MNQVVNPQHAFAGMDHDVAQDMIRRVTDIDNAYRSIAEKAGQLYMRADEAGLNAITEMLDKPMRDASTNHQAFTALLADLKLYAAANMS